MWWDKAAELVHSLQRYRDDYYGADEDEEAEGREMLPILTRRGHLENIRVRDGMTVKQVLRTITRKENYGLIQVKRDVFSRIIGRIILDGDKLIDELEYVDWECDEPSLADIWLVDLTSEVSVFFNSYFRMITGCPIHLQRLFIEPGMTVADFEQVLKESLAIPLDDVRFGLYGHEKEVVSPLDPEMLMSELLAKDTLDSPSFFQFQFHAEYEEQSTLGSTRASNLFMRANRGTRRLKKCWFTLQGTSLFYRPSQTDHSWRKEIKRVDLCKVVYRGANRDKTTWRFDLVPPEGHGPIRIFTSALKRRIVKWVNELRSCHETLEINEPVTLASLKAAYPNLNVESSSTSIVRKDEAMSMVNFYQRRMVETAEALLNKIELDGGVLLLNGLDEMEEILGRKWIESVRELLYHCIKIQATKSCKEIISIVREVLRRIRSWVGYFEGDTDDVPTETSLKEIIEDSARLVTSFRFFVLRMNSDDDMIGETQYKAQLEDTLETLQDALCQSIFAANKRVKKHIVRGVFRADVEIRRAKEEAKMQRKLEKERAKRREERAKQGIENVWTMLSHGTPRTPRGPTIEDNIPDEYDDEVFVEEKKSEKGWLAKKLTKWFANKKLTHNPYKIEYEDGDLPDDRSFSMSMENGDRLSEARWSEAEAMFRQYSKRKGPAKEATKEDTIVPKIVIQSGFDRRHAQSPLAQSSSIWNVPEVHQTYGEYEEPESPIQSVSTLAEPIRAGPEDEALLLRMLKDPRVRGLLDEFKEQEISQSPAIQSNTWARRQ